MLSIDTQFLNFKNHHKPYDEIDPLSKLHDSAKDKVVFISGASRGIGQATAIAFAQAGAKAVYILGRTEAGLQETIRKMNESNPNVKTTYNVIDVTNVEQVHNAVEDCVRLYGGIDVVDANAGLLNPWIKIGETDVEKWWNAWEVNIKGVYLVVRFTIKYLIESAKKFKTQNKSGGHIILLSSIGAQLLSKGASDYQTTKHAINRLCEFINVDHQEDMIKVFAVHPGGVHTSLALNMPKNTHQYLNDDPFLAGDFIVWLTTGKADWASGRYLSATWDVSELLDYKKIILEKDLLVNRLRTKD